MKKIRNTKALFVVTIFIFLFALSGCVTKTTSTNSTTNKPTTEEASTTVKNYYSDVKSDTDPIVLEEIEKCFDFFWETQNTDESSAGYGLVPDRYNSTTNKVGNLASIASVGYGLSAIPIGVAHGFITYEEGEERAYKTLLNLSTMDRVMGFYYHFYGMKTATPASGSEVSIIDTAIFLNGALTAGKYFGGRCEEIANEIYKDVVWTWYYDSSASRFYMGYDHTTGKFSGYWGNYAEQMMIFILASGSPKYTIGRQPYNYMKTVSQLASATDDYGSFYMSYSGSLFVYQYAYSWFDSEKYVDSAGFSWYTNSLNATKAAYAYSISKKNDYFTYSENSWGMSACDGPDGYSGAYGSGPSIGSHYVDGTVALYAAVASINYLETESLNALQNYRNNSNLWSKYGLIDSYNLGARNNYVTVPNATIPSGGWYGTDLIGIDKGNELLMLENYNSGLIWNIFMDIEYVQNAMVILGFSEE